MANRTKLTAQKKKQFLEELSKFPNVSRACRVLGVTRHCVYDHKAKDEEFAAAWEDAWEHGIDRAEEELYRRAVLGHDKPVIYQGEITDTYKEVSDTALIFLLKGRRGEIFKERSEVSGPGGGPLQVAVTIGKE